MGLFTPGERERAEELAGAATDRPDAVVDAVREEGLLEAGDEQARVHATQALADAAAVRPGAVAPAAGALADLLDDGADVRSNAERALGALADHRRERGEAALDRAEERLAGGDVEGARAALERARERFAGAEALFATERPGDPVLDETLGVETVDGAGDPLFTPLVTAGTALPAADGWTFTTGVDGQRTAEIRVVRTPGQVEDPRALAPADEAVATLRLAGLPPAPAGVPVLEVRVEVGEDGGVTATLLDRGSGTRAQRSAGTAAVASEGGASLPASEIPAALADRVERVDDRLERAAAARETGEASTGDPDPDPEPMAPPGAGADASAGAASTPGPAEVDGPADDDPDDADGPATPRGPAVGSRGVARGERASSAETPDDAATVRALVDVRDDLRRAVEADTDDADVVRKGVSLTARKLERLDDDADLPVAAVRAAIGGVVDGGDDGVAAVRGRAREALATVDEALSAAGVTVLDPDPGDQADADRHRVVEAVASERPAGTVVGVEGAGYERDGTVKRPAKVRVSAAEDDG